MTRADFLLNEWDDFEDPKKKVAGTSPIISTKNGPFVAIEPKKIKGAQDFHPNAVLAWHLILDRLQMQFGLQIDIAKSKNTIVHLSGYNSITSFTCKEIIKCYKSFGYSEEIRKHIERYTKNGSPLSLSPPYLSKVDKVNGICPVIVDIQYCAEGWV